ncbi:hypothetical protein SLEP1_g39645 [Rubroshorea leprosula]|uniref:Uncharacterized protein n=1 Tax=Rubroshorea leprosula TaxID=152421 RepID=A0AAV5L194_9ROSI|nr:hypothetical protein SLEP1_g39645 [Rubroshorea leprosula]
MRPSGKSFTASTICLPNAGCCHIHAISFQIYLPSIIYIKTNLNKIKEELTDRLKDAVNVNETPVRQPSTAGQGSQMNGKLSKRLRSMWMHLRFTGSKPK